AAGTRSRAASTARDGFMVEPGESAGRGEGKRCGRERGSGSLPLVSHLSFYDNARPEGHASLLSRGKGPKVPRRSSVPIALPPAFSKVCRQRFLPRSKRRQTQAPGRGRLQDTVGRPTGLCPVLLAANRFQVRVDFLQRKDRLGELVPG